MGLTSTLKDIMRISIKQRDDGYSDQYSRIFMTKVLLICSVITTVDYFSDGVNCMIPNVSSHSKDFFNAACWINGFYIYDEMRTRLHDSSYYGIPQRVDHDGINYKTQELCHTQDQFKKLPDCISMTKVYFLQFQWMPVYLASLSLLFYMPYLLFRIANTDIISLKKDLKGTGENTTPIIANYFNYSVNSLNQLRIRIWWNMVVKLLYVLLGFMSLYVTDYVLMGRYNSYGTRYWSWYSQNNTLRHAVVTKSVRANAGNALLPSMGLCDVHEASLETRVAFHNQNKFICEISPHILYQYVLMVLWFFFVAAIVTSIVGAVMYVLNHLHNMLPYGRNTFKRKILAHLTLREMEYLDVIKEKDMVKYGDILKRLLDQRLGLKPGRDLEQPPVATIGGGNEMELDKLKPDRV